MSLVFSPYTLGDLRLRNRLIKTATYEGMVHGGRPTARLRDHHVDLARGGIGMTTIAYCAVSPEGRTFANQLVMDDDNIARLRGLTDAVHREGAAASLQLGHCGGFSKNEELGRKGPLGPSRVFNAYGALKGMPLARAMTAADIARTTEDFVRSVQGAREAGFDAVEVHLGHGYLLSQFLSPHRNKRTDAYGGSLENRARFPLEVVRAIRAAVPASFPVLVKLNLDDGVDAGLHVDECVTVARWLEEAGASALVLSGGLVSHSALYLLRGERPLRAMVEVETNPLQKVAIALFGPFLVPTIPFEPLFFLEMARKVRAAVRMPLVYVGGAKDLPELEQVTAEGFELIALGRGLVHDPMLPERYRRGERVASGCSPCNACITEMDRPGGLVCARSEAQLARRSEEVARGYHLELLPSTGAAPRST